MAGTEIKRESQRSQKRSEVPEAVLGGLSSPEICNNFFKDGANFIHRYLWPYYLGVQMAFEVKLTLHPTLRNIRIARM
jgi:hypothetical protein